MEKIIVRRELKTPSQESWQDIHPLLQRIYQARGIEDKSSLDHNLAGLLPFTGLKDIDKAAALLAQAIIQQKKLLIIGDYDADGATSTALAMRAFRLLGAKHVEFLVPNRFEYGYGLTPEIVAVASKLQPDVIITVDNGIASCQGVAAANQLGIQVVITDHHLAGNEIPAASAIVNPNQPGDNFASKNLAGVGVIFYVMLAVRQQLRQREWFTSSQQAEPNMAQLLDLVALGTVADVVPLDHNNRILVKNGLERIRKGVCSVGITALLQVAKCNAKRVVASDLGFFVGPRLNAAGRLDDMSLGITCLLSDDPQNTQQIAQALDELNQERRAIEAGMQQQALAIVSQLMLNPEQSRLPVGLCLYDTTWHQGVIGIVAARVKEKTHRPVICFGDADDDYIKGSARSIPGVHIRDVLDRVATKHPELITKFGGHAMAAGLTLLRKDFEAFNEAFVVAVQEVVDEDILQHKLMSDGELATTDFCLSTAALLRDSGPWGQHFPEPIFDGEFKVVTLRVLGEKHLKLTLEVTPGLYVDAIAFNVPELIQKPMKTIHAAYRLDVNEYRNEQKLQLLIEHIKILQ